VGAGVERGEVGAEVGDGIEDEIDLGVGMISRVELGLLSDWG
jgi:hypothetical protein